MLRGDDLGHAVDCGVDTLMNTLKKKVGPSTTYEMGLIKKAIKIRIKQKGSKH